MPVNIGVNIQRSPNRINQQLREAGVEGKFPKLLLDFKDQYYLASGGSKTLANAVTHARSGNAVMTDGYGDELIVNGGFDSDASGWTNDRDAVLTVTDGKLNIANSTNTYSGIIQEITLKSGGGTYDVELDYTKINSNARIAVGTTSGGNDLADTSSIFSSGKQSVRFTTTTETVYVKIYVNSPTSGDSITIDNVSVREMPVLKWAPHNLLAYSEDFSNAAWAKTATTITANAATAPDGTTTADEITHTTTSGAVNAAPTTVSGVKHRHGIFVKNVDASFLRIYHTSSESIYIDLSDGSIGTDTTASSSVTALDNDWFFVETEFTTDGAFLRSYFSLRASDGGSVETGTSAYLWGAHAYRSDLGGMVDNPDQPPSRASYVPTTSSAVYLPRVGHHVYNGSAWVNEGLLAESEARTNLLTYSNDFTDSYWAKTDMPSGGLSFDGTGPDGVADSAVKLIDSGAGGTSVGGVYISRDVTVNTSSTYTFSVYAKKDQLDWVALLGTGFTTPAIVRCYFDLNNGVISSTNQSGLDEATIQDVGNGWYLCSITFTTDSTDTSGQLRVYVAEGSGAYQVDLDSTSSILVYGAQFEQASTPSSLIPTSGSSVTRAAESFTIPSANLPWPEPNYIGSERLTGSWASPSGYDATVTGTGTSVSVTGGTGQSRAWLNIDGVDTGEIYYVDVTVSNATAGVTMYLRDGTNPNGGDLLVTESFTSAGGSRTAHVAAASNNLLVLFSTGTAADYDATVSVREIDPLSVSIAMDGRMTYADENSTSTLNFLNWAKDSNDSIQYRLDTQSTRTGQLLLRQREGGASIFKSVGVETNYTPNVFVPFNMAGRHGSTFVNGAVEGVATTVLTTPTALPDLETGDLDLAYTYMGTIGTFRVWDRDITDNGLVEATNPSLEPSLSLTFEGTGTNSFIVNDWSE